MERAELHSEQRRGLQGDVGPPGANNDGLIVFEIAESPTWEAICRPQCGKEPTGNPQSLGDGKLRACPVGWAVYDAAVFTTALDVRPDFRFAIWPRPLFFASADRVAAYSGATIG